MEFPLTERVLKKRGVFGAQIKLRGRLRIVAQRPGARYQSQFFIESSNFPQNGVAEVITTRHLNVVALDLSLVQASLACIEYDHLISLNVSAIRLACDS